MSYPILLSLCYCSDQTSLFIHHCQYLIISYFILSAYFSSPLHNHISSACNLLISSCSNVQVSHPYNTTGHTNTFTILFFNFLLNPFVKSSFLLLNASSVIAILVFTSISLRPSSVIIEPRYLKLLTCSILCPSTVILTTPPPSQRTIIVFVCFLNINFHVEVFGSIK